MKYTISGLLLFINVVLYAQPAFKFSYDASGNRIKRELIDLSELPEEPHEPGEPEVRMADPQEDPDGSTIYFDTFSEKKKRSRLDFRSRRLFLSFDYDIPINPSSTPL